jgi:hypothetical protein
MDKQQAQLAVEEAVSVLDAPSWGDRISDLTEAARMFGGEDDLTAAFSQLQQAVATIAERITSPEFSTPVAVPTTLVWEADDKGQEVAQIIVPSGMCAGLWELVITNETDGFEVTLECDGFGVTTHHSTHSEAKAAAQAGIEAVAAVLTDKDGDEFIADEFRFGACKGKDEVRFAEPTGEGVA